MMHRALTFFSQFEDTYRDWLLDNAEQHQYLAAQELRHMGELPTHLYVVLDGMLGIYQVHADGRRDHVGRAGPGQMLGELDWLNSVPVWTTVIADEPSLIMSWSLEALERKLASDDRFGARFYRAIARNGATKRREEFRKRFDATSERENMSDGSADTHIPELNQRLRQLKDALFRADKVALRNDGEVPAKDLADLKTGFHGFCSFINDLLGDDSRLENSVKQDVGVALQHELLPYLSLTGTADRFYAKPRGYAGDYLTIAKIYDNVPTGTGRIGPLLDACFLAEPAAAAVRNRRHLLRNVIDRIMAENPEQTIRVTSLACGPAQELFDVYENLDDGTRLKANCVDIDMQALAFVADRRDRMKLGKQIQLHNGNLIHLATGRQELPIPQQHLIYSIGLIDYFGDSFVISLMNFAYDLLLPGGRIVLGNFHPRNPDRAFMDHILEWRLIHRSEADMHRLFRKSKFGRNADAIHFEEEGINLFAECIKHSD